MTKNIYQKINKEFTSALVPKPMAGFYRGELTLLNPGSLIESIGGLVAKFWLPWRGKTFYAKTQTGDNILTNEVKPVLAIMKARIGENEFGGFHAFPFKTSIQRGLHDNKKVLRLDYNLRENPENVRHVIDEVVQVGENNFLGKAYIGKSNTYRFVAFFRLRRA